MPSKNFSKMWDVVIVGGGLVGLSLWQLMRYAQPEIRVALIEAKPFSKNQPQQPSFDQRSTALSSGSADILNELGLWQGIAPRATAIHQVHVSDKGHIGVAAYGAAATLSSGKAQTTALHDPLGFVVPNAVLGQQLSASFPEENILAPAEVLGVKLKQGKALCDVSSNDERFQIESDLLIIADGIGSSLRTSLGMGVSEYDYEQAAVIANVTCSQPHLGIAYERFTPNGPMALLPLGGAPSAKQCALVWTQPKNDVDTVLNWSDEEFLKQLQAMFGYRQGRFLSVSQRAHYPLKLVMAKEQVRSSLVIMGNAAHFLHPVAGQGFNLALRDCAQLVSVLKKAHAQGRSLGDLSVLDEYLAAQYHDQHLTTQLSHGFNRVFSSSNKAVQLARNLGLLGLENIPPLKREFFSLMMGKGFGRAAL